MNHITRTVSESPESRFRERAKLVIEALTLAAVIFYGAVAYYQWGAMITANQQTKAALHITERAYVTAASPHLDIATKFITFFLSNNGHIPSGNINVVVHEATIDSQVANSTLDIRTAAEYHWKRHKLGSMPPGNNIFELKIPIRHFLPDKYTPDGVFQAMLVAGRVEYYDGFPDDGPQLWTFCFSKRVSPLVTTNFLSPLRSGTCNSTDGKSGRIPWQ
jgi:hypothetical protein